MNQEKYWDHDLPFVAVESSLGSGSRDEVVQVLKEEMRWCRC